MFDCHIHLDEQLVSVPGLLASMDEFGVERAALIAGMVPDLVETVLVRLGGRLLRRGLNSRRRGLRRVVRGLYRSTVKADGWVDVGGKRYSVLPQPDNGSVRAAVERHPERFVGWIFVNPAGPIEPLGEIERCLATRGMIGVKCHPFWHTYPVAALETTAAFCEERRLPMLVHLGTGPKGDFTFLPTRFPDLTVVYAHAGIPYEAAVCDLARARKNVFVDISSPGYVDLAIATSAIRRAGADKCLFGTDGPYFHHAGGRMSFRYHRDLLAKLQLPAADRERVARENFVGILRHEA